MINTLKQDLKQAMIDKDAIKKGVLQIVISKINNTVKERKIENLPEADELSIIQTEVKQTSEALELFRKGNREDLVKEAIIKLQILTSYLPKQLSETELMSIIKEILAENNISNPLASDKGKIMKCIMPQLKGKADGKLIDKIVMAIIS